MARDDPEHYRQVDPEAHVAAGRKIVLYVHHNGLSGPIARVATVARRLQERGAEVTVLAQDEIADSVLLKGLEVVSFDTKKTWLPSANGLKGQIKRLKPDVLVVSEYPFVAQEYASKWEEAIDTARKVNPKLHVCGISPDIPIYPYFEEGPNVKARSARVDQILITGDPQIIDFDDYVEAGEARESVAAKKKYVGFMDKPREQNANMLPHRLHNDIVVYLGGSAQDLQNKYVSLLANIPLMNDDLRQAHWHIIMPAIHHMTANAKVDAIVAKLPEDIKNNISIEAAGTDAEFTEKLRHTDMVIVGGGQSANKTALVEGLPTIIVPSHLGEQHARAKHFSEIMPDRVARMHVPAPRIKHYTGRNAMYAHYYHGYDPNDTVGPILKWAEASPEAAEMRATIERVYQQRGAPQPNTRIMLDGAKRIANEILSPTMPQVNRRV